MRVAINGIGVAGPALAYWLRHFGHEPVLFEKAPRLRTGGYLIDFWGLGYDLAERIGILPVLIERGYIMEELLTVDAAGRPVARIDVAPMRDAMGGRFVSVARTDLSKALFDACAGVPAHFGESIAAIEPRGDAVAATLSTGRTETFDLIVGADGLHSEVRALTFGREPAFETSLDCYVAAVHLPDYPKRDKLAFVSYTTPKRQASRIALRDGETMVLFICRSELIGADPPKDRQKAALRRAFAGMEWEVPDMLDRMDDVDDVYFDRVSQIHLPKWSEGRVALVGDAAACVSLLAGEGTGLAMVEAYVLAGELAQGGRNIAGALASYEARLRKFIAAKQKSALRFRGYFAPATRFGLAARDVAIKGLSIPAVWRAVTSLAFRDDFVLPDYGGRP